MGGKNSKMFLETSCELLRDGYPIRFCAKGQSMKPTIQDGELIIIEPVEIAHIKRGDIILYRAKHGVIAHRVVRIAHQDNGQPTFILRGDSAASYDGAVPANEILGRVVAVEREGRSVNLSSRRARRLSVMKVFLYKLRSRVVSTLKLTL